MDTDALLDEFGWNEVASEIKVLKPVNPDQPIASTSRETIEEGPYRPNLGEDVIFDPTSIGHNFDTFDIGLKNISEPEPLISDQPAKKKRGRPRKSEFPVRPTRASSRTKKCPEYVDYGNGQTKCDWSNEERRRLLAGLEEFGSDDIEGIKSHVLTRSDNEIKNEIRMWEMLAAAELQKKLVTEKKKQKSATVNAIKNLNDWINQFETQEKSIEEVSRSFALSNFFLLAAEYAVVPKPEDCNGVDFRAIYRYIHCMLNGKPFYGMNPPTAKVLDEMISNMFSLTREPNQSDRLQSQLYMPKKVQKNLKTYNGPGSKGKKRSYRPESVLSISGINPLNLPPSVLTKPSALKRDAAKEERPDDDYYEPFC